MKTASVVMTIMFLLTSITFAQGNPAAPPVKEVDLFLNKYDKQHIERTITQFVKMRKVPGLSIAIANRGHIVFNKSYGLANKRTKLTPSHRFRMPGASRLFTSTAIMTLLQDGKLSLEDEIFGPTGILKEYRVDKYTAKIKVRHLLENTVGKPWAEFNNKLFGARSNRHPQIIQYAITKNKLRKDPGKEYYISKFGYYILARVVEKISGKTYEAYIQEMTKDIFKTKVSVIKAVPPADEVSYLRNPNTGYFAHLDGYAGVICAPSDFLRLMLAVDGNPVPEDILQTQVVKIMQTPSKVNAQQSKGWYLFGSKRIDSTVDKFWMWENSYSAFSYCLTTMQDVSIVIAVNGGAHVNFRGLPAKILGKIKDMP